MRTTGLGAAPHAVIGGLGFALSFPPWSEPWLAPVALAVFFVGIGRCQVRDGAVLGLLFGLAFFGPTLWWVNQSIAPAAWAALVVVQASWLAALGAGLTLVRRLSGWPVWTAALWTLVEGIRSSLPWGGLPWGRLGYTAVDTPWAGLLAAVGVTGTSAALALLGAMVAVLVEGVRQRRPAAVPRRAALVTCSLGAVLLTVGACSPWGRDAASPRHTGRTATIAIVQGQVPGDGTDVPSHHREITRTLLHETQGLSRDLFASTPDLVVWPENATAVDPATDGTARDALIAAVDAFGVPVLAGAVVNGPTSTTALNQGILWTAAGPQHRYTKQHLVPFGEYVPLRPLASLISARVSDIERDMVPGPPPSPLRVGALLVANALCFDVAYDDVLREQVRQGAGLAVVQTSNAMFLGTAQQEQQWMVTRARAIELGRSVVVSSMNGISGAVAPDGTVLVRLPAEIAGSTSVAVPVSTQTTPAVRLGRWPARTAYGVGVLGLLVALWRVRVPGRLTPE